MKKLTFLVLGFALLAGCARTSAPGVSPSAPSEPPGSSGIEGMVVAGPACPGPQIASSPCPPKPVSVDIQIVSAEGPVTKVRSGEDGRFSVDLPPGGYTLIPKATGPGPFPFGRPMDVNVEVGKYAEVTLQLDTGIR